MGNKNEGIDDLLRQAIALAETGAPSPQRRRVRYSKDIETAVERLRTFMTEQVGCRQPYNPRWTAIKLLEDDRILKKRVIERCGEDGAHS